jgi:hypothetical protein
MPCLYNWGAQTRSTIWEHDFYWHVIAWEIAKWGHDQDIDRMAYYDACNRW